MLTETRSSCRVSLASQVALSTQEVISACMGLASAEKALIAVGAKPEADELGQLFDCLEDRLFLVPSIAQAEVSPELDFSGSNSSEREFTQ